MAIDWQPLIELIEHNESFLLTSHMRPDCDALGSELGLALMLEELGKWVRIVNGDVVPNHIAFIDPKGTIQTLGRDISADEAVADLDVLVVLDTSAWGQLGPMADVVRQFGGTKVVVDHHVSQDDMTPHVFKNTSAEATGRLVLELAEVLGVAVTPEMAKALFAAIATDTGWFRFSSVSEETFLALAKLVAAGASPPQIFSQLFEQHSLQRLLLRGRILQNVQSLLDGRLLWTEATADDFRQSGAELTDTEDVINQLHSVAGCEVAIMFVELKPDKTKVSLRSKTEFDVREIAAQFGGGGHRAAAGVAFGGTLAQARTAVLEALSTAMQK